VNDPAFRLVRDVGMTGPSDRKGVRARHERGIRLTQQGGIHQGKYGCIDFGLRLGLVE
jgi:hypothetical protein